MIRKIQLIALAAFSTSILILAFYPGSSSGMQTRDGFRAVLKLDETTPSASAKAYKLKLTSARTHSLSAAIAYPGQFGETDVLTIALRSGSRVIAAKTLHAGDPDLYTLFKPVDGASAEIEIKSAASKPVAIAITVVEWPEARSAGSAVEAEPNDSWREANRFQLGQTVWATADDKPYIVPLNDTPEKSGRLPYQQTTASAETSAGDVLPEGGIDWFKFNYEGDGAKLAHFEIDLLERDNLPVDVSVFKVEGEAVKPYEEGMDPVSPPHEVQALPGNKFTTRIVTRGTYYVRVEANHVFYQLRTSVYDAPPYSDPRAAIRAGMDYIVSAGDSWHANTPRHGGIVNRVSSNHAETQLCIACHATHFSARAELTAKQNGYEVRKRSSLQFLTERLSNNPRPFYGHPEAYWTRVISASANVMSRLASLVNLYEKEFDAERKTSLLKGVGEYLKIYYKGRAALPNDETNGNMPIVSAYEVAWYSWKIFDELHKQTGEKQWEDFRAQLRSLIEQDAHKNLIDLCYQTLAFAELDRAAYQEKIKRNSERILSLQRADGQWSMLFEPASAPVEFQTYHCLYTLARAGYGADHPQIAKSLKFLMDRQQNFGGWFDPRQTYENFRTPFRETQFAVMALSEFYKGAGAKGWQSSFDASAASRLDQLDRIWDKPGAAVIDGLNDDLRSDEPLIATAAAAALGRVGDEKSLAGLTAALGAKNKMVQIAAAQAVRRISTGMAVSGRSPASHIRKALASKDERARWAATRIFAQHFAYLTPQTEIADRLIAMMSDESPTVRMQSIKSLMQWFWWTKDEALQERIADAFVARMGVKEHPWARRSLIENFYSLADENVRYLYNNWIALLARKEDKDLAVKGHHEASRRMAQRIAKALETGNELQREGLLAALTEFHLRSGGYLNAGRYARIGNDVETIKFYQEGAPVLEKAIIPYLNSNDVTTRKRAVLAAYMLRENSLNDLPLLVMKRLLDEDPAVRGVANEFYAALPLEVTERNRREAVAALNEMLSSNRGEARIAALDRIKSFSGDFARSEKLDERIRDFVLNADRKVSPAAIRALSQFPHMASDSALEEKIASAVRSNDQEMARAALQLALARPEWSKPSSIAAALDEILKTKDSNKRRMILGLIGENTKVREDLRLLNLVAESLEDSNDQARAAALSAVRRARVLASHSRIRPALAKIANDPNERLQEQAIALYQGDSAAAMTSTRTLDYDFFVRQVMPLLAAKGRDGNACVNCHSNHTILKLNPPDAAGRYSPEQLRENYQSALRVVDLVNPEYSLLLRKPTTDSSQEGVVGAKKIPHGGGQRWAGPEDSAYRIVLEWINGAKN